MRPPAARDAQSHRLRIRDFIDRTQVNARRRPRVTGQYCAPLSRVPYCSCGCARLVVEFGPTVQVVAVNVGDQRLTVRTPCGDITIDGKRYEHLEHGYALTAHKAQGITVDVALVVGSEAASREWAYSVLSRARQETRYFAVATPSSRDIDGVRHRGEKKLTIAQRLTQAWSPSEAKDSTLDYRLPRAVPSDPLGPYARPELRARR